MSTLFISPNRLAQESDGVTVVDVREPWEYETGHVPGAVNVPFSDFRDPTDETPGKLPTAETFGTLLGDRGISPDDRLVVYDDEFGVYASRFLVTAEVFGHDIERLRILDGDYTAWTERGEVSTDEPSVASQRYPCDRLDTGLLVTAGELDAALDSDTVIIDTRDPVEYDTVHLPGAVNFQWRALVDEAERRLEPPSRCREILTDHGISFNRPVRLYCNTARRLSFVYTVLRDLGHDDVAFYEGGIAGWADYGGPVETT